jgi:hypothetical protein
MQSRDDERRETRLSEPRSRIKAVAGITSDQKLAMSVGASVPARR